MPTHLVNTHEAKSRLSELIRKAENGDDVIVARNGEVVAKIIPWPEQHQGRRFGAWKGRIEYDGDLIGSDPDILADFEAAADRPLP